MDISTLIHNTAEIHRHHPASTQKHSAGDAEIMGHYGWRIKSGHVCEITLKLDGSLTARFYSMQMMIIVNRHFVVIVIDFALI